MEQRNGGAGAHHQPVLETTSLPTYKSTHTRRHKYLHTHTQSQQSTKCRLSLLFIVPRCLFSFHFTWILIFYINYIILIYYMLYIY